MASYRQLIYPAAFFVLFILYFLPFPLHTSFVGNTDAIGQIGIFYDHFNNMRLWLGLGDYGNMYYPAHGVAAYTESYIGEASLFFLFRMLGLSDIWSSYGLVATMYALNGISVYLLIHYYLKDRSAAFIGGLVFAASSYMLSNMELMNGLAFFCIPIAVLFLEKYSQSYQFKFLSLAIVFGMMEYYFSAYHFLFGGLLLTGMFLWKYLADRQKIPLKHLAMAIGMIAVLFLPVILKLTSPALQAAHNPLDDFTDGPARFSLSWYSLISPLPENLLYAFNFEHYQGESVRVNYYAFLGFTCLFLTLIGVIRKSPRRLFYILVCLFSLLIAFGPFVEIGTFRIAMPLKFLYQLDIVERFIRLPGRVFTFCIFGIAIFCALGYQWLEPRVRYPRLLFVGVILLVLVENIEFFPKTNDHSSVVNIPEAYNGISDPDGGLPVIAEFPSSIFTNAGYVDNISEFSREYRYQYWQTKHHMNVVNGSTSYFPLERMANNELMTHITDDDNLSRLIEDNGLDYVTYHKDLTIFEGEKLLVDFFRGSPLLEQVLESDRIIVFQTKLN